MQYLNDIYIIENLPITYTRKYPMNRYHNIFIYLVFTMVLALKINAGTYTVGGYISGGSININADILSGNGHLDSSNISIQCNEFAFKGTITSYGKCIIRCKKPFDYTMFTKKGFGSITVIISPYDFVSFTKSELCNFSQDILLKDLEKTHHYTNDYIATIRYYAVSNKIDEKDIFKSLFKKINEKITYHEDVIDGKYDTSILGRLSSLLVHLGISAVGLGITYHFYHHPDFLKQFWTNELEFNNFVQSATCVSTIFSVIPGLCGFAAFLRKSENKEDHRQKLAQLLEIKENIKKALINPLILEKEEIIKLQ